MCEVSQRVGVMLAMPGSSVGNQPDGADPRHCTAYRIPGIICTRKGCIVVPAQIWQNGASPRCRSTICYSRDNGKTWKMGTGLPCSSSECQVVELKDGSLMLNCRNEAGGGRRVVFVTRDMGETWEPHETDRKGLNEPSPQPCQAGFVAVQTRKYGRLLLFSNPQV